MRRIERRAGGEETAAAYRVIRHPVLGTIVQSVDAAVGCVVPAHGTVIAVNYAILREFSGANFGVPIGFGKELLGL